MQKRTSYISILALTFALVFVVGGFVFPQEASAAITTVRASEPCPASHPNERSVNVGLDTKTCSDGGNAVIEAIGEVAGKVMGFTADALLLPFAYLSILGLQIAKGIFWISGVLLNNVILYTIVNMSATLNNTDAINVAWSKIRDLANMTFIFILLYAAIKTIIGMGSDTKGLIVRVIVVAILINFSLFFTKVVIDASNILAVTFYDAMVPGGLNTEDMINGGLANELKKPLKLGTIIDIKTDGELTGVTPFDGRGILIAGLLGSIFVLIAAFVLFSMSFLLIVRFVVLMFVLILSPIAFMASVLPGLKSRADQWKQALFNQAFFAPIFFILMWIVLGVTKEVLVVNENTSFAAVFSSLNNPNIAGAHTSGDAVIVIMNFIIIIVLLISSLVISKSLADKAGGAVGNINKWLGKAGGGVAFGGMGWLGRNTVGRLGANLSQKEGLQTAANTKTGLAGAGARLALYASKKAGSGTFDARNATIPTSIAGDSLRGTVGRTALGKKMGLDDVNVPSIALGSFATGQTGLGEGGTKGFVDTRKESKTRINERETTATAEWNLAKAKKTVQEGSQTGASATQIAQMEKVLAKSSDKEVETLVAENRKLLESQQFANSISVKQLEALNKSDKFSEVEKNTLKGARFAAINSAVAAGGAGAASVRDNIKRLTDSELEMIDPVLLEDKDFVAQLKSSQIESINKSNKFTASQKGALRDARISPLMMALDTTRAGHAPNPTIVKDVITKQFNHKDVAGLMGSKATFVNHAGTTVTGSILAHPEVMENYTPKLLKRMAEEMGTSDIQEIRQAIETAGATPGSSRHITDLANWLNTPDGSNFS